MSDTHTLQLEGAALEVAEIDVVPGAEEAFVAAVAEAAPYFQAAEGCRSLALTRSDEFPSRFRLIVGWDSVDDHMVRFRNSPGFQAWREIASPHFAGPPRVEHIKTVLKAF